MDRTHFYIDGRWQAPVDTAQIEVISPVDGRALAKIPAGTAADVDRAVDAARQAFDGWAATPPAERAAFLKQIQAGLKARAAEIAQTITQEMGCPIRFAQTVQVGSPVAVFSMYAKLLGDFSFEESIGHSKVVREPIGVVAAITPWNYPLHQVAAKVAAALAAGCTVVLKPSEIAPLDALILAEAVAAVGLPPGVFNLVTGAGQRVSELAAATVKRVALELGGKSAAIVLDDADFAVAIPAVVAHCYQNAGQTCTAQTRLLVPESRYDEAAERAVAAAARFVPADPRLETTRP